MEGGGVGWWEEGRGSGGCTGMDGGWGWGSRSGARGGKQKEGQWRVESGCEMTLLEHGFKYQNKVPNLAAPDFNGLAGKIEARTSSSNI